MSRADFVFINPEVKNWLPGIDWGASTDADFFNQGNILVEKGMKAVFDDQNPTARGIGFDIASIVQTVVDECKKHQAKINDLYIIGHGNATQGMRVHTDWLSYEGVKSGGRFRPYFRRLKPYTDGESQLYLHACGVGSYLDGNLVEEIARLTGATVSAPRAITTPFNFLGHRLIDQLQNSPAASEWNWDTISSH